MPTNRRPMRRLPLSRVMYSRMFTKSALADGSILSRGKSEPFLGELRGLGFESRVDLCIVGLTAGRDGCIEHGAKRMQLGLAFLDQAEPFADHLARGAVAARAHDAVDKIFPALTNRDVHATSVMSLGNHDNKNSAICVIR